MQAKFRLDAAASRSRQIGGAVFMAFALAACAASQPGAGQSGAGQSASEVADNGTNDPAESVNRAIFAANMKLDRNVMRPVAKAYRDNVPEEVRRGIHNAASNLREPSVVANDLLQGNPNRAWVSAQRFAINTTAGVGGVFDVAKDMNLPPHSSDFGQTLAVWGVGEGPYVQLPALGPSNVRDAVGTVAGMVLDPLSVTGVGALTYLGYARTGADVVDKRSAHIEDLDELERSSIDYYATLRSVSRQQRQAEIDEAKQNAAAAGYVEFILPDDLK